MKSQKSNTNISISDDVFNFVVKEAKLKGVTMSSIYEKAVKQIYKIK